MNFPKDPPGDLTLLDLAPDAGPWVIAGCALLLLFYALIAIEWLRVYCTVPTSRESRTMNLIFIVFVLAAVSEAGHRLLTAFYANMWILVAVMVPEIILLGIVWLRIKRLRFFRAAALGSYIAHRPEIADLLCEKASCCPGNSIDPTLQDLAKEIRELSRCMRAAGQ